MLRFSARAAPIINVCAFLWVLILVKGRGRAMKCRTAGEDQADVWSLYRPVRYIVDYAILRVVCECLRVCAKDD
jgi:hypothetical protein